MTPGPLLLFAFVALATGVVVGSRLSRAWLALTVIGTVAGLSAALMVLLGGGDWEWRSGFLLGGELLHLRLDAVSALFLVLLSVVGGAGGVYAREYGSDHHYPGPRHAVVRGGARVLNMGLVLTVSNGLHFLTAWSCSRLAGILITLDRQRREARAGWYIWGRRTRARCASSPSSPLWRNAPEAGTSAPCASTRNWHRCSGWRCSVLA